MTDTPLPAPHRVPAHFAARPVTADPAEEYAKATDLRTNETPATLLTLWDQYVAGSGAEAATTRRVL